VTHIRGRVGGSRDEVEGVHGELRLPSDNGTRLCAKGAVLRQSRLSDNSHGQLGAVSLQCHLIKAHQALPQSFQSSTGP